MTEKKKENLPVLSVLAIVVPLAVVVLVPAIGMYTTQKVVIANQENHFESSAKHEEKQDEKINGNTDAIQENRWNIERLGPAGEDAEVARVIAVVQDEIDCRETEDNTSGWIYVPAASRDRIDDKLRVRVEEHFRGIGYEVGRQRQLEGGQWQGFWLFVDQSQGT